MEFKPVIPFVTSIMRLITTVFLLISSTSSWAQCYNGEIPIKMMAWGIGFIDFPSNSTLIVKSCKTFTSIGELKKMESGEIRLTFQDTLSDKVDLKTRYPGNYISMGNRQNTFLTVQEITSSGDFRIFKYDLPGLIVTNGDLDNVGGRFYSYDQVLKTKDNLPPELGMQNLASSMSVCLQSECIPLRKLPNHRSDEIICLKRHNWNRLKDLVYIKIVSSPKDRWIEIEAQKYLIDNSITGEECRLKKSSLFTGWIEYLDETGSPNIWYYVSSY